MLSSSLILAVLVAAAATSADARVDLNARRALLSCGQPTKPCDPGTVCPVDVQSCLQRNALFTTNSDGSTTIGLVNKNCLKGPGSGIAAEGDVSFVFVDQNCDSINCSPKYEDVPQFSSTPFAHLTAQKGSCKVRACIYAHDGSYNTNPAQAATCVCGGQRINSANQLCQLCKFIIEIELPATTKCYTKKHDICDPDRYCSDGVCFAPPTNNLKCYTATHAACDPDRFCANRVCPGYQSTDGTPCYPGKTGFDAPCDPPRACVNRGCPDYQSTDGTPCYPGKTGEDAPCDPPRSCANASCQKYISTDGTPCYPGKTGEDAPCDPPRACANASCQKYTSTDGKPCRAARGCCDQAETCYEKSCRADVGFEGVCATLSGSCPEQEIHCESGNDNCPIPAAPCP